MRVIRACVDAPLAVGARIALPEEAAGHLVRVLRLGAGDACVLFNGDGRDYRARIASIAGKSVEVEIESAHAPGNESPLRIVLVQGIARGEKMDWILQKATELGVAGIVPVHAERGEVRLDEERAGKRLRHWRSVVVSACEQSGRATVPEVAACRPMIAAMSSVWPLPSTPAMPTISPRRTTNDTPSSAGRWPGRSIVRPSTSSSTSSVTVDSRVSGVGSSEPTISSASWRAVTSAGVRVATVVPAVCRSAVKGRWPSAGPTAAMAARAATYGSWPTATSPH